MGRYTTDHFLQATTERPEKQERFELETPHLLEVNLRGRVWAKAGSMIGYAGEVKFTREGMFEHGVGTAMKKMFTGEGMSLMKMEGQGRVYLADGGKQVQILELQPGERVVVNGNDLLALEEGVQWEIKMLRRVSGMLAGGLFNVHLQGPGMVAMTSHHRPLTLRVTPEAPVYTDPNATVAWSGSLQPEIRTDISFRTLLGRGSGESIQLVFRGQGWVVLQPYEEVYLQQGSR